MTAPLISGEASLLARPSLAALDGADLRETVLVGTRLDDADLTEAIH